MNPLNKVKLISIIPGFGVALVDIFVTIFYQPASYWQGNLQTANEANPIGAFFMHGHISGIFILSGLWLVLIVVLAYLLPTKLSKVFTLFVLFAHSFGASSWIMGHWGFADMLLFFLSNAILYYWVEQYNTKQISI
ncbi:hypothetical protein [Labilibacter marinus]|uniref:hypothetical protein n=1 Tax=Labilibacter marinus TaxID=1477105 RepID=UPI000830BC78|nr:hypothetical protein [Labilibacter marinus]